MINCLYKRVIRKFNEKVYLSNKYLDDFSQEYDLWIKNNEPSIKRNIKQNITVLFKVLDMDNSFEDSQLFSSIKLQGNFKYTFNEKDEYDCVIITKQSCVLNKNCIYNLFKEFSSNKYDAIYSDSDYCKVKNNHIKRYEPKFKPDYSNYTIRSCNYIGNFIVVSKKIYKKLEIAGKSIYRTILDITRITNNIKHISKILYHDTKCSIDLESQKKDLEDFYKENNENAKIIIKNNFLKTEYMLQGTPLVSIIIPNKDNIQMLNKCLESINKSTYKNYEIIIVENNSTSPETFAFYDLINKNNIRVEKLEIDSFNFSKLVNFGVKKAKGEYIILLNNDIEIINSDWIENFLMYAMRNDVGVVGAKLYFKDASIQHAGVVLGIRGLAGHIHRLITKEKRDRMYTNAIDVLRNTTAITAACLIVKKSIYLKVNGFDEKLAVDFNDVDFCIKVHELGKKNIYNPYIEAFHYESVSRNVGKKDIKRFNCEFKIFRKRWKNKLYNGDQYYNCNLRLDTDDVRINYGKIIY